MVPADFSGRATFLIWCESQICFGDDGQAMQSVKRQSGPGSRSGIVITSVLHRQLPAQCAAAANPAAAAAVARIPDVPTAAHAIGADGCSAVRAASRVHIEFAGNMRQ